MKDCKTSIFSVGCSTTKARTALGNVMTKKVKNRHHNNLVPSSEVNQETSTFFTGENMVVPWVVGINKEARKEIEKEMIGRNPGHVTTLCLRSPRQVFK